MAGPQPVRGTRDLLGEEFRRHLHVTETARRISGLYGFAEWATPIFEQTEVFARSLGESSDVVSKEMYSFADRGGESLTLRPEGTAGVCRALVSNGLTQTLPQKVFYAGPMFRYERPQKGRYRQFHQIGLEVLGAASAVADAEVICCGRDVLEALGVAGTVTLELNTLGDGESRAAYRAALVEYFSARREGLSAESVARLEKNPLRILDSKDEGDRAIVAEAPVIGGYLTVAAAGFWDGVRRGLDAFGVGFVENPRIVRGLDYYSHTAFEFVTDALGAQGTVLAGGRYDGLVAEMGGPSVPAVGWAAGVDRLALLMRGVPAVVAPIVVCPAGEAFEDAGIGVLRALRGAGLVAEMAYGGSLKKRLERADKRGARAVVIVGEGGVVRIKELGSGVQVEWALADVAGYWTNRHG